MTEDRELTRRWVETWQRAGEEFEEIRMESVRIFELSNNNPKHTEILRLLRGTATDARGAKVRFASPVSDVIEDAEDPRGR